MCSSSKKFLKFFIPLTFSCLYGGLASAIEPPGLADTPPCLNPDQLPNQAKVPCLGIAVFSEDASPSERQNAIESSGASMRSDLGRFHAASFYAPNLQALQKLNKASKVVDVLPDRKVELHKKPPNPGSGGGGSSPQIVPSGVQKIGAAPGVLTYDGSGIGVAIVDTGIDLNNADLNIGSSCFDGAYGTCMDDNGHGTHVSGIVAAKDNDIDVVGVAPMSIVYAVKVLDQSGGGYDSDIMAGLQWVAQNASSVSPQIKVVNLSLGRPGSLDDNPVLRSAFQDLKDLGLTVVVSAGNDPTLEVSQTVPATYPEVMAVASVTAKSGSNQCRKLNGMIAADTASYFTTDGAFQETSKIGVTISAPGAEEEDITRRCSINSVGISSLKIGGGVIKYSGTSMSAPHVSGVAALLLEQDSLRTLEDVRSILRASAYQIGTVPYDSPTSSYSFDGEREGSLSACRALSEPCP